MTIAPKSNILQNPRPKKANFFFLLTELSFTHLFQNYSTCVNFQCGYLLLETIMPTRGDFAEYFYKRGQKGARGAIPFGFAPRQQGCFVSQLTTLVEDQVARKTRNSPLNKYLVRKGFSVSSVFREIEVLITDLNFLVRFIFPPNPGFFRSFWFVSTFKK